MSSGLYVYQLYSSIKLHFTPDKYDFFKYGLNTKTFTEINYRGRNDRLKFEKIWNHFKNRQDYETELRLLFASCFLMKPTLWIGDIADNLDKNVKMINDRHRYAGNYAEAFKKDMDPIFTAIEMGSGFLSDLLASSQIINGVNRQKVPKLVEMIPSGAISPETVIILDMVSPFINSGAQANAHIIWKNVSTRLMAFRPFMNVSDNDLKKVKTYIKKRMKAVSSTKEE